MSIIYIRKSGTELELKDTPEMKAYAKKHGLKEKVEKKEKKAK